MRLPPAIVLKFSNAVTSQALDEGALEYRGPTWRELATQDWSYGPVPRPETDFARIVRANSDLVACFLQMANALDRVDRLVRSRPKIPNISEPEIFALAFDAAAYRLTERVTRFAALNGASELTKLIPSKLREMRKRRGEHAHNFDGHLVDLSGIADLIFAYLEFVRNHQTKPEVDVLGEVRSIYRRRLRSYLEYADGVYDAAYLWVEEIWKATQPKWAVTIGYSAV